MGGAMADVRFDQRDFRMLLREATRPDGTRMLLRWLAERLGVRALLLNRFGELVASYPEGPEPETARQPQDLLAEAADTIASVLSQRFHSAVHDAGTHSVRVLAVDAEQLGPVLVVARRGAFPDDANALIADVVRLLRLRWRADEADRRRAELERAESLNREAILHMLMVGQLDGARRAAGALGQRLPDVLRVYLVESAGGDRAAAARRCSLVCGHRAWIIPCPVYRDQLIVLVSAADAGALERLDDELHGLADGGLCIGAGEVVPLRDTAAGYQQAFHALAVARSDPARFALFSPRAELDALLGVEGVLWARAVLSPLLDSTSERSQDPDSGELLATLQSWLSFYGRAAAQLKVHRNTVATRLRRIERTLSCDLTELETQAVLHLAVRLLDRPRRTAAVHGAVPDLDSVLDTDPVRQWAAAVLAPILDKDPRLFLDTLRTWLVNNARLDSTAAALGVSVPGARKRLLRIEEALGRSLLNGPSARYDLLFALRIRQRGWTDAAS
ncbi:helix-turn-helix domain-containing protein [Saccharopolyspora erythraea]|nr:helix-turn-helix domain-containing protein [Saccharopolyspora erythraea]